MSFLKLFIPATLACLCNASANTIWKLQFMKVPLNLTSFSSFVSSVFTFKIIFGLFLYAGSTGLFFYMLSSFKMAQVVPILALTYVFNLFAAYFILHESVSTLQIIGICVIISGILLYSRG